MTNEMAAAPKWDARYQADEYVFGTAPAQFMTAHATLFEPGQRALVVADGEGRNSVWLAQQGLTVTAMDISSIGADKARALASERGVAVDVEVADVLTWDWEPDAYDVVVAVFIQFLLAEQRGPVFEGMVRTLRPGGRLLLHGYRPEQIAYATGGPPLEECMYTEELLTAEFQGLDIERLTSYDAELDEGAGHAGVSALIDFVGRKPLGQ
ncbi:MAG: class I SAM-dependent methyltransferase [Actinomycetota bacterium]